MSQHDELKRLAEAATPGRNFDRLPMAGGGLKYECTGDDGSLVLKVDHKNDEWGFVGDNGQADEEFFLACTPAAVLALIFENDRLSGECEGCPMRVAEELRIQVDELKAENAGLKTGYQAYEQVNAELKAEVEKLRGVMACVVNEVPRYEDRNGNAPGHCHSIPGVWDQSNGAKSGTECGWCKVWNAAVAMSKEPAHD
ncbi:hypothetical protein [Pseudomonas rhizophila]